MQLTLDYLLKKPTEIVLMVGDDELRVTYLPGRMTWVVRRALLTGIAAYLPDVADDEQKTLEVIEDAWRQYCETFAGLLVAWDVVDEKDKPLPTTAKNLQRFPMDFVVSLARAVARDSMANPRIGVTSPDTSPTKA